MGDPFSMSAGSTFDLTKYLTEEEPKPQINTEQININERKLRAGVKKIDLKAQKYIVGNESDAGSDSEEDLQSDIQSTPVLEACDLYSLLEQFEATEMPDFPSDFMEDTSSLKTKDEQTTIKKENVDKDVFVKQDIVKVEKMETEVKVDVEEIKPESKAFVNKEIKMEPVVAEEAEGEFLKIA